MLYAEMEDGYRSDELLNFPFNFGPRSLASGVSAILVPRGASAVNDVLEMARSEASVRERLWDALNAAVNEHRSSVTLQLKESKACQPDVMGLQAAFDLHT